MVLHFITSLSCSKANLTFLRAIFQVIEGLAEGALQKKQRSILLQNESRKDRLSTLGKNMVPHKYSLLLVTFVKCGSRTISSFLKCTTSTWFFGFGTKFWLGRLSSWDSWPMWPSQWMPSISACGTFSPVHRSEALRKMYEVSSASGAFGSGTGDRFSVPQLPQERKGL